MRWPIRRSTRKAAFLSGLLFFIFASMTAQAAGLGCITQYGTSVQFNLESGRYENVEGPLPSQILAPKGTLRVRVVSETPAGTTPQPDTAYGQLSLSADEITWRPIQHYTLRPGTSVDVRWTADGQGILSLWVTPNGRPTISLISATGQERATRTLDTADKDTIRFADTRAADTQFISLIQTHAGGAKDLLFLQTRTLKDV